MGSSSNRLQSKGHFVPHNEAAITDHETLDCEALSSQGVYSRRIECEVTVERRKENRSAAIKLAPLGSL